MPKTIYDVKLIDLIPPTMVDEPQIAALCAAFDAIDAHVSGAVNKALVLADIDDLQSDAVDLLSLERHVDYYNQTLPVETRRNLVKNSGYLHMFQGTPGSVEQLTTIVLGTSFIQEWFEYGGDPYTFRLMTTNKSVDDAQFQEIVRMLAASVNARSHMDGFYYYGIFNEPLYYGVGIIDKAFDFILCGTKPTPAMVGHIETVRAAVGVLIAGKKFDFTKCGPNLAGVLPSRSTLGIINSTGAEISVSISQKAIDIPASGNLPAGTLPTAATIGAVSSTESDISVSSASAQFDIERCGTEVSGPAAGAATVGNACAVITTISAAGISQLITYAKCGSLKAAAGCKNTIN